MKTWTTWRWREQPDAPLAWADPQQRVVIVDSLVAAEIGGMGVVGGTPLERAERAIGRCPGWRTSESAIWIYAEPAEALEWWAERGSPICHEREIPALLVERQGDLCSDAIAGLMRMKAQHRALVITPREAITLSQDLLLGSFLECPDETQDPETDPCRGCAGYSLKGGDHCGAIHGPHVDLVVVQGPVGPDAWPVHPAWIRCLRDACAAVGVAFAFTSWGEWKATGSSAFWQDGGIRTEEERGIAMLTDGRVLLEDEPAEVIRERDRAAGYHIPAPSIIRDQSGLDCLHGAWRREDKTGRPAPPPFDELAWLYRTGVERSGRLLPERGWARQSECLELPAGLR